MVAHIKRTQLTLMAFLPTKARATALFLAIIMLLSACSEPVKTPQQLSAPGILDQSPAALSSLQPQYIIQVGDKLEVKFYYSAHLDNQVTVRPDGRIVLPLVHDVPAATLTTTELTTVLKNKYSKTLIDPEISVIVRSFATQKVYVDGEVKAPGMVNMDGRMTILQAIASVGGMENTAKADEVLLIRQNGLEKPFVMIIDLEEAQSGEDITQNIWVDPLDIIFVPKKAIANVNDWVELYLTNNLSFLGLGIFYSVP